MSAEVRRIEVDQFREVRVGTVARPRSVSVRTIALDERRRGPPNAAEATMATGASKTRPLTTTGTVMSAVGLKWRGPASEARLLASSA
jgi:hypothetical protein